MRPQTPFKPLLSAFLLAALAACSATKRPPASAAAALTEEQKIDRLIASIATLPHAKFIRKGTEYDASAAAQFLRGKRAWLGDKVKNAHDFVTMASGGYLGAGDPYYIKFADGRVVTSREWLTAELDQIDNAPRAAIH